MHIDGERLESFLKAREAGPGPLKCSRIAEVEDEENLISRYSSEGERGEIGPGSSDVKPPTGRTPVLVNKFSLDQSDSEETKWLREMLKNSQAPTEPPVKAPGFRHLCATSRIVLGLNQVNNDALYFSNRTWLSLACRAFHLTHYVPGLETVLRDDQHLAWYEDGDECVEKIGRYLKDAAARERIAEAGCALAHQQHQYYHRVGRILELVRGEASPTPGHDRGVTDLLRGHAAAGHHGGHGNGEPGNGHSNGHANGNGNGTSHDGNGHANGHSPRLSS